MLDAMLVIFGVILGPKVGVRMDKMAGWADAGQFYVWTRSSPINLGQVDVRTRSGGEAEKFSKCWVSMKSAVQIRTITNSKIVINLVSKF